MERVVRKNIPIPFPIIGIPIRNLFSPYVTIPSTINCDLHIKISEKAKTLASLINSFQIEKADLASNEAVFSYVNKFLNELNYRMAVDGNFSIECTDDPPSMAVFAVVTTEILKAMLKPSYSDYTIMLDTLALFDERSLGLDPGYCKALRCSYLYNNVCIARGYDELIRLGIRKLAVKKLSEITCPSLCKVIDNPYDANTLSFFYKFSTHIIGLLAQAIKEWSNEKFSLLRKFLDLYMILESSLVKEFVNSENLPLGFGVKPIVDYKSIKLYKINAII
jgi:hypothetical protein